ncbi:MAG TPA: DUF3300 domain-containing protein, partial [Acidocella sp.]|nr:DUF3300 domain-containing protein [Acidocella sp.]
MNMTARSVPSASSTPPCLLDRLWPRPGKAAGSGIPGIWRVAQHSLVAILSLSLMMPADGAWAQAAAPGPTPTTAGTETPAAPSATKFNLEQLDAMLAPIALYPDDLLMQTLMATTYPLQIVEATRWLKSDNNKDLKGDALARALEPYQWDPSVKSLVPFPQVLEQLDEHLDWTQQIGYAMATQQEDVMNSIQRLRLQAQGAGSLKTTEQQVVSTQAVVDDQGQPTPAQTIVIQPADPEVVYVPAYNPSVVYGTWPYPSYPPVSYPPPAYYPGAALATGVAFAAGVAVVGSLWGWAGANWGYGGCCGGGGSINVNRERYNNITVNNPNRGNFNGGNWQASSKPGAGRPNRPPGGPVKAPARVQGLPANAVGRSSVSVPNGAVNRPNISAGARPGQNRPGGAQGGGGIANANRPGGGNVGTGARPAQNRAAGGQGGTRIGNANRANAGAGGGGQRLQQRRAAQPRAASNRSAFGGMNDGARAGQFQQRGSQSRAMQ